jgi:hypothetical protein
MQEKRRPHVGDIAIERYGALIYLGVVEEVGWLQPDSEYGKGAATCYTVNDPKFYGLSTAHYWQFSDPNTVFIAPPEFVDKSLLHPDTVRFAQGNNEIDENPEPLPVLGSKPGEEPF